MPMGWMDGWMGTTTFSYLWDGHLVWISAVYIYYITCLALLFVWSIDFWVPYQNTPFSVS